MKKYSVIYADPPWDFGGRKLNAATGGKEINDHYPTMPDDEIKNLPIRDLAEKDCALFMWTVHSKLDVAIEIMRAWGFRYVTIGFEWLKRTETGKIVCFMGAWTTGGGIELCLFGKRGAPKRQSKTVRRLIDAPRGRHSEKPAEVRERIVALIGDVPRIELFAREKSAGWDSWGNEIPNDVELTASLP